jgi:hypothetical protein
LDIRGILIRQKDRPLDWPRILRDLQPLAQAKEKPEIFGTLENLRIEAGN